MKQWTTERCAAEPAALQLVGPDLYIQRRNIHAVERPAIGEEAAYTDYECESREITESEYEMLQSIGEIQTEKAVNAAIDEYTMQLIEEGVL